MTLFTIHVPVQYFNASHDVLRMLCIQVVVQFLFNVVHPSENPFFSMIFLQTISFVLIGVAFYWLVVHYLVAFEDKTADNAVKIANSYNPALHTQEMNAVGMHSPTNQTTDDTTETHVSTKSVNDKSLNDEPSNDESSTDKFLKQESKTKE